MDRIWIGCVMTTDAVAELSVLKEDRTKVYVTYYRRKTNREITEYKGAKTIAIMDELIVKVKARIKEKPNLTLWSY
jgi:IMP cyclohydrolase